MRVLVEKLLVSVFLAAFYSGWLRVSCLRALFPNRLVSNPLFVSGVHYSYVEQLSDLFLCLNFV